jgi:hypothetical protein
MTQREALLEANCETGYCQLSFGIGINQKKENPFKDSKFLEG